MTTTAPVLALPDVSYLPVFSGGELLTLFFYLVLGFYAIYTGILYYHWNAYSSDVKVSLATYIAYAAITVPLLLVMFGSLAAI